MTPVKITHGTTAFDGSLASDVPLRRSAQRWGGCAFLSNRSSRPAEHARYAPERLGMAFTYEPSEIAWTLADLARSTSYVLAI